MAQYWSNLDEAEGTLGWESVFRQVRYTLVTSTLIEAESFGGSTIALHGTDLWLSPLSLASSGLVTSILRYNSEGVLVESLTGIALLSRIVVTGLNDPNEQDLWYSGDDVFQLQSKPLFGVDQIVKAEAGDDLVYAGSGNDHVSGGYGNDALWGMNGNDNLYGGQLGDGNFSNDDRLFGGKGNDTLEGGDGNDELRGQDGDDHLDGGGWVLSEYLQLDDDLLFGGTGNDVLMGRDGSDMLHGGSENDQLLGGVGADILRGGSGDDMLSGDAGDDTITGGDGSDSVFFLCNDSDLTLVRRGAVTTVVSDLFGTDVLSGVEVIYTLDGAHWWSEDLKTWELIKEVPGVADRFEELYQDKNFIVWNSNLLVENPYADVGEDYAEWLHGYSDRIYGAGGNDYLYANAGDDFMDGGAGIDTAIYGDGFEDLTITWQGEDIVVVSSYGVDTLHSIEHIEAAGGNTYAWSAIESAWVYLGA